METPLFFKNNNYKLFGVLHEPDEDVSLMPPAPSTLNPVISSLPSAPSLLGIVFCHPFAEEKLISHRVLVNLARSLCNEGYYVLRFDYMGQGDSDGKFEDVTVKTQISDIKVAMEYFRERTKVTRVGLLGVRLGATLACLANENAISTDFLILISPIIDGSSYIEQSLRSNLTTQLSTFKKITRERKQLISDLIDGRQVNIDGYLWTGTLYKELQDINLLSATIPTHPSVLIIHISRKDNEPVDHNLQELYTKYNSLSNGVDILNLKAHFFWTDTKIYFPSIKKLENSVVDWLNNNSSKHMK